MQAGFLTRCGVAALFFGMLSSCEDGTFGATSFRGDYAVARNALEAGNYEKANRSYAKLVQQAGPVEPRIRLEYAHSQLRAGNYAAAAEQARYVASQQKGIDRGAALAVLGTAEHEMALQAMTNGQTPGAKRLFKSAQASMAVVLKSYPTLDPLGGLAQRQSDIKRSLKRLG